MHFSIIPFGIGYLSDVKTELRLFLMKYYISTIYELEPIPYIGLVDADLLNGGTRHPNLALLKLAGFLKDNGIKFRLIIDNNEDISEFTRIYISKVFSFTPDPLFYTKLKNSLFEDKFVIGGTGYYAVETDIKIFREKRIKDLELLENDPFLNQYRNRRGGHKLMGISMAYQMPYYDLYEEYVNKKIAEGRRKSDFDDYLEYSIGFLTRGCFRHCPFCVNKLEKKVLPYSPLETFLDSTLDKNGKLKRKKIYLWDDNFLAADRKIWKPLLEALIKTNRPFQFRQGLDERIIAESEYGEEIAEMLSKCKYHGDYIFAFDNWKDREKIETALKIWKRHVDKETKFYLFCGYRLTQNSDKKLYQDIWEIFQRIRILMSYGCLGYIMRHEDYHKHPLNNIYIQIARWCNQPQFYKKMSFWEFCYRNQSFWEQRTLKLNVPDLKSYYDFKEEYNNGYYRKIKMTTSLKSVIEFINYFKDKEEELIEMFNYRLIDLINPKLWSNYE